MSRGWWVVIIATYIVAMILLVASAGCTMDNPC